MLSVWTLHFAARPVSDNERRVRMSLYRRSFVDRIRWKVDERRSRIVCHMEFRIDEDR